MLVIDKRGIILTFEATGASLRDKASVDSSRKSGSTGGAAWHRNIQGTAFSLSHTQKETNLWKGNPSQRLVRRNIVLDLPLSSSQIFYVFWDLTVPLLCFLIYCTHRAHAALESKLPVCPTDWDSDSVSYNTSEVKYCTANGPWSITLDETEAVWVKKKKKKNRKLN